MAIAWCISMVLFPGLSIASAKKGIALWADVVLPALLPFFICANFMISLGIPGLIGQYFERPFQRLFGAPGSSAFVFLISVTSGYPMGAKLIGDLCRQGEITTAEAKRMLCFCSTSGPLFLLGTVGVGMLHSAGAGALIAVSHYLGAIANGIFFHLLNREKRMGGGQKTRSGSFCRRRKPSQDYPARLLDQFTDAILSSMKTLGIICCYLILFNMAADLLEHFGAFRLLEEPHLTGFLKGILEMTIGCNEIAASAGISLELKCALVSALISFGGISIFAQSMSVLYGLSIHPGYYLAVKMMHGVFAVFFSFVLAGPILQSSVAVGSFGTAAWEFEPGYYAQLLFSSKMIIMIMVAFAATIAIGRSGGREEKTKK